ncbi:hypothetical protein L3Q82_024279, partial [Scortum barcoo]
FWMKRSTYEEQPVVRFQYQTLFLAATSTQGDFVAWSSFPHLNNMLGPNLRIPAVSVREEDKNQDGKLDLLIFNLELPLKPEEQVYSIQMLLTFSYQLFRMSTVVMQSLAYVQYSSSVPGAKLFISGDLRLQQRTPLPHRGLYNIYNVSVIDGSSPLASAYDLNNIIRSYQERNCKLSNALTTVLSYPMPVWTVGRAAGSPFQLNAEILYPMEPFIFCSRIDTQPDEQEKFPHQAPECVIHSHHAPLQCEPQHHDFPGDPAGSSGGAVLRVVFSQHPSVFYLMEPAWHVWTKLQKPSARVLRMAARDILRSVFQCDFSVMESYLPEDRKVSSLFMWSHSRALCSPPACPLTPRGQFSNQTQCIQSCDAQGLQGVEEACGTYSHVVLKGVRFFELESLYPLLLDPSLDLRIIHLVRDPRAVMRSREESAKAFVSDNAVVLEQRNVPAAEVQYQVMQEICRSHVRINERAVLKPPPFLKGRYKMVRYEDVVRNPEEEINDMYEFVGLEMTKQLAEWIYMVTHGTGKGSKGEAFKITSRNAADVSQAWRTTLPYNKVKRVQE